MEKAKTITGWAILASRNEKPEDFVRYNPGHLSYGEMPLYIQSLPVIGQDEAATAALFAAILSEHPGVYKNARIVPVTVEIRETTSISA
jgi:hypothetical protein